jgi:hypothetical protein
MGRHARRVPLDLLLSVAVLSPAQAALVAVRLLDAVHVLGSTNGTHPAEAGLWSATLGPSGEVEVSRAQEGAGTEVTDLLVQLSQNARRLPAHPRPEQVVLLHRLEEAAAADPRLDPGARARELEEAMTEVLGSGARQRLTGQLAALVDAFAHIAASVTVPAATRAASGASRAGPRRAAPTRPVPSRPARRGRRLSRRRTRARRTALVVLLAVALAASGYVVLRDPGNEVAGARGRHHPPGPPSATAPSDGSQAAGKHPRSRPGQRAATIAPRHAGAVAGVRVQKAGACTPGALCPVTVTVRVRPAATTRAVTWKVGTVRSCRSGITWSPPTSVTAQPGWTTVYASSSVPVPRGRSLALVALSSAPARAQSPPVPVAGSVQRC